MIASVNKHDVTELIVDGGGGKTTWCVGDVPSEACSQWAATVSSYCQRLLLLLLLAVIDPPLHGDAPMLLNRCSCSRCTHAAASPADTYDVLRQFDIDLHVNQSDVGLCGWTTAYVNDVNVGEQWNCIGIHYVHQLVDISLACASAWNGGFRSSCLSRWSLADDQLRSCR